MVELIGRDGRLLGVLWPSSTVSKAEVVPSIETPEAALRVLRLAGRRVKRSRGGMWHVGLALLTTRELIASAERAAAELPS